MEPISEEGFLKSQLPIIATIALVIVSGLVVWQTHQDSTSEIEYKQRAVRFASGQDWSALQSLAQEWQRRHPDSAMAHAALADSMRMRQQFHEAAGEYAKALQLDPENHQLWAFHGIMSLENRQFSAASDSCKKSVSLQPHHADGWYCLALASAELGDAAALREALTTLGKVNPQLHETALAIINTHICPRTGASLKALCK